MTVTYIKRGVAGAIYSGGLAVQDDATLYAAFQHNDPTGAARVFGCVVNTVTGVVGPDEQPPGVSTQSSIDPGAAVLGGQTYFGQNKGTAYRLHPRLAGGSWGAYITVPTLPAGEVSMGSAHGVLYVIASQALTSYVGSVAFTIPVLVARVRSLWDIVPFAPIPGARVGAEFADLTHFQKRSSIAACGSGILAAWNQPLSTSVGGRREIWTSYSADGGATWGFPVRAATSTGDLCNPFCVQVGAETRIYFEAPMRQVGALGMVSTTDGKSFTAGTVILPAEVLAASRPNLALLGERLLLLASWQGLDGNYNLALVDV